MLLLRNKFGKVKDNTDVIDLTKVEDLNYSTLMRELRQLNNGNLVTSFQKIFKKHFDSAVLENKTDENDMKNIINRTLKDLSKSFKLKLSKDVLKDANTNYSIVKIAISIPRFSKVTNKLYRGGAPSIKDISALKKLGITKIVSLDLKAGNKIDKACKLLGIKHIMLPIEMKNFSSIDQFSKMDLKKSLLLEPTFIHCQHGKDRTGLLIALLRIQQGWPVKNAIKEANSFGFTSGLAPEIKNKYYKTIENAKTINTKYDINNGIEKKYDLKNNEDTNDAFDIVHNIDLENTIVNPTDNTVMPSFAPYSYNNYERYDLEPYGTVDFANSTANSIRSNDDFEPGNSSNNNSNSEDAYVIQHDDSVNKSKIEQLINDYHHAIDKNNTVKPGKNKQTNTNFGIKDHSNYESNAAPTLDVDEQFEKNKNPSDIPSVGAYDGTNPSSFSGGGFIGFV